MIGETISHYRVVSKVGEGGMGVVYKAEDTRLDRTVALKFLASHLLADEESRLRFVREAKAAAALDHPNICTVYEIDEVGGRTFISMAFIEGPSLADLIAAGPQKIPQALDIARQAARGLQEAHSKGIVHRDIKPANIMVSTTASGELRVKITDFGLAQLTGVSKLTKAGTTLGTVAYMSPEQTQGNPIDLRTDIWSLGVILYEMITARQPFRGHYEQAVLYSILNEQPAPLATAGADVPLELEWIIAKALAKNPDDRYPSTLEVIADLETVLAKVRPETAALSGHASPTVVTPPRPLAGRVVETGVDLPLPQRRRRIRDLLLVWGSQGLLTDRVLSQALELLAQPVEEMNATQRRRDDLLNDVLNGRVRAGEFIETWQQLESAPPDPAGRPKESARTSRKKGRDWRTQAEIFGLPLIHRASGVDPETGVQRVAKGVIAVGEVALGVVAIGRQAAGVVAVGVVSAGLVSAGALTFGLASSWGAIAAGADPSGWLRFPVQFVPGVVLAALVTALARLLIGRRRFREQGAQDGSTVSIWAILGGRVWRSDGTPFRGGNVISTFGGCDIDLTDTEVAGAEAVIEATAIMGGVKIIVAPHWRVVTRGAQLIGGYANKTRPPKTDSSVPAQRLLVKGFALLGSVEVVNPAPGK
jgi:serine/threonine protein kinase